MRKVLSLAVSVSILCFIYYRIDLSNLLSIFKSSKPAWLAVSLLMFVPTTIATAMRLKILSPDIARVDMKEALKLVLAGSSLNIVLPSKMGDIAKGYFIAGKGNISLSNSLSLVVYEKTCDILGLLLWCVLGLFFYTQKDLLFVFLTGLILTGLFVGILMIGSKTFARLFFLYLIKISSHSIATKLEVLRLSWIEMCDYLIARKPLMAKVATMSIVIQFMQLLQIWFFVLTLGGFIPLAVHLGLTPLAIFAGLVPLTFAGVGTRDAALIFFLRGYLNASLAAALGILCTFRYFVPAIAGLPFLNSYVMLSQRKSVTK